jgi:hypothetical protein
LTALICSEGIYDLNEIIIEIENISGDKIQEKITNKDKLRDRMIIEVSKNTNNQSVQNLIDL